MQIRPLSAELEEKAREELNEVPGRLEEDLTHIKEWLAKQPHLNVRQDDQWLVTFLRGCKSSLERTKQKIDMYYTMRTALPEFFSDQDPMSAECQELLSLGFCLPLSKPDPLGRRIIVMRPGRYDPNRFKIVQVMHVNFFFMDYLMLHDDHACINGIVNLMDLTGVTLAHATQMSPSIIQKSSTYFQEAYPLRPKGMNYIHLPPTFETVLNLFKSFMKEKLKRRIYVHGENMESLYSKLPQEVLPEEYGGSNGSLEQLTVEWKAKIESMRAWYLEDGNYRTDESKRPGKPRTQEDLFGMVGSFRKLNVD